jgi:hypothetical protein
MPIAPDLKSLLPKQAAPQEEDDRPVYYLWVFDPDTAKVLIEHNEDKHPADHVTHQDIGAHIHHPDKIQGYAYSIKDGWRITNDSHDEVKDPFVVKRVLSALRGEHPEAPLPHLRYHRL